jgi:hypothetical protein
MTYGEKPEAHIDSSPVVSAFKANFVRRGLVFHMHNHHFANDMMGWAGFTHQLAENCYATANSPGVSFPAWDPACLDLSRLTKTEPPEEAKVDGPPTPERHPDHTVAVSLLFHLPKNKAAELKRLAMPTDGSWIATYDAFLAFMWRSLTRLRAPVFNPDMSSNLFWAEAVDMRRRLHTPKCPPRIQQNGMFGALSPTAPVQQPTVAEFISEWSLSKLASYIRAVTDSVTQEDLDKTLDMVATVRDKTALYLRCNANPPMSILQTDHRDANMTDADFGFARPAMYRHVMDFVTEGIMVIYAPRSSAAESNDGPEFSIAHEQRLANTLINDTEWSKYFEYLGVDAVNAGQPPTLDSPAN